MNSKRKVSAVDERILRENEYIGRVLNAKVKELDRLKGKLERKLQQERENFAVHHLSVTNNFKDRNGPRKKISLALESTESKDTTSSISDSIPSDRKLQEERTAAKIDCLFPPIRQNSPWTLGHKRKSSSFSDGKQSDIGRRSYNSPGCTPIHEDLPKWQKDLIEESRREEEKGKQTLNNGQAGHRSSESYTIQIKDFYPSLDGTSSPRESESNVDSRSDSSTAPIEENRRERAKSFQGDGKRRISEYRGRQKRSSTITSTKSVEQGMDDMNFDMTDNVNIDLDGITRVNMVKNLTKEQRFNLQHKFMFLPPMGSKFREGTSSDLRENVMDAQRLNMAKKRWLKAYNIAKANFQGKGPQITENPIQEIQNEKAVAPEDCTKDRRLLDLVSLLSNPNSLSIGTDNEESHHSDVM